MWGESISGGRGEARRVGRRDCSMRRAFERRTVSQKFDFSEKRAQRDVLLPSFKVRSSGGASSGWAPDFSGARRSGLELVNEISAKMSRFDWTCASDRHCE